MFTVNEDLSIYVTRGDTVYLSVTAANPETGEDHLFKAGDVVRFKVYGKKDAENVVLQKDIPITADTNTVDIVLEDTKIGEVISKPKDYWYEVELNPFTNPTTIIGYDEDGAKVFKLFPEGDDIEDYKPIKPEDIPIVDDELDMLSHRPVENQAIARAIVSVNSELDKMQKAFAENVAATNAMVAAVSADVVVERARIDNQVSAATVDGSEVADIRVGADGFIHESAGNAIRTQIKHINDNAVLFSQSGLGYLNVGFEHGLIDNTGAEFIGKHRIRSISPVQYDIDITLTIADGFRAAVHFYSDMGEHTSETGWITGEYTIPAKTFFRVVIASVSEDAAKVADILEFRKAVVTTTIFSELLKEAEEVHAAFVAHDASDVHLKSVILSNNLADPERMADGGYYAYNNGAWVTRSDITTTGLIPCVKGQVYYSGINNEVIRGGNCTFWDELGAFVSGTDVPNGSVGYTIPDDDRIKYLRISLYTSEKDKWHINLGEYKEYDAYKSVYVFSKEFVTPTFDSTNPVDIPETGIQLRYTQAYKDDVTVQHKRNTAVGTSYQVTIINKEKFDGTDTKVAIEGTSHGNPLGDGSNTNVPTFAKNNEYLHIINGGIYLVATGEADGITIINGNILKSTGVEQFDKEQYVLGITASGDMKTYINQTAETILADGCIYALTGFVPLIQDGETVSSSVLSVCPHYNARHPRQIVGILADGNYFTFCCDGRTDGENGMTLQECIDTITRDFSVKFAFNLDGGGSTQTAVGNKQVNRVIDGRTIPNVITFK